MMGTFLVTKLLFAISPLSNLSTNVHLIYATATEDLHL
jgi:hypothetical protein